MRHWPHAPPHSLDENGAYLITASTYQKKHLFHDGIRRDMVQDLLLRLASRYGWRLDAWAVMANHYHFVGGSPNDGATSLRTFLRHLHSQSARELNRLDEMPGRKVWHNYTESHLTHERSYFARLHYVHVNPVRHGLAVVATAYRWCSAAWFEQEASQAQVEKIYSFPIDRVNVEDDF